MIKDVFDDVEKLMLVSLAEEIAFRALVVPYCSKITFTMFNWGMLTIKGLRGTEDHGYCTVLPLVYNSNFHIWNFFAFLNQPATLISCKLGVLDFCLCSP